MNFLHTIKSAQILGIAIATTLLATQLVQAQTSLTPNKPGFVRRPGTIEFTNKGAYLVDYFVSYNLNNNSSNLSATSVSLSQKKRFEIPAAATNLQVEILYLQAPNQRKPLLPKTTIPYRPGQTICFTTIGTIFNPTAVRC
jgi:hypothetical protein